MKAKLLTKERVVHDQFVRYGRNAKEWLRKCALLLPEIARGEIWKKKRFGSIYEYAAKLAGMSRASVDEALRVLRKIQDKPELLRVVAEQGLQRVRPVAAIATPGTAAFWAEKARDMSKNTLETYVKDYRANFLPREKIQGMKRLADAENNGLNLAIDGDSDGKQPGNSELFEDGQELSNKMPLIPQKQRIEMELDSEVAQKLLKLKGSGDWNELMKQFLEAREEKLEAEKPAPVTTEKRHIPAAIEKYVIKKTNGQCAFPNCTKSHESLHHTQRFKLEKIHDPDRLMPLCREHERIAHLGLIDNEEEAPENWRLRKNHDPAHHKRQVDEMVWLYR